MRWRIVLLVVLVAGVAGLFLSGAHQGLTPERLRTMIQDLGPLGAVLFVVAFAVLEPLHVPGVLFLLTAPLVWPLPVAFLLSLAGGTGAGVVALLVARLLARDWVQEQIPERWRAWDERLAARGFRTVVLIRLVTFLAPAAHWVIGLSRVRATPAVLGTAVGLAPGILLFTWFGAHVTDWLGAVPGGVWVALAAVAIGLVLWRRRRRGADQLRAGRSDRLRPSAEKP